MTVAVSGLVTLTQSKNEGSECKVKIQLCFRLKTNVRPRKIWNLPLTRFYICKKTKFYIGKLVEGIITWMRDKSQNGNDIYFLIFFLLEILSFSHALLRKNFSTLTQKHLIV